MATPSVHESSRSYVETTRDCRFNCRCARVRTRRCIRRKRGRCQSHLGGELVVAAPNRGCGVLSVISGDCSVPSDAFSPGSGGMTLDPVDADALSVVQEGAEVLPAFSTLSALSTLVLAAGAFQLGWHIGTTVNNKWLHLYGVGLGDTSGFSTGGGTMSVSAAKWVYRTTTVTCGTGCTFNNPAGWVLTYFQQYGNAWNMGYYPGCYGDTLCPGTTYWADQGVESIEAKAPHAVVYTMTGCSSCVIDGHVPAILEIPTQGMNHSVIADQPLQPYTGQSSDISSGWASPSTGAGVTSPAPGFNGTPQSPQPCVLISGTLTCLNGGSPSSAYSLPNEQGDGDPGYQDPATNLIRHVVDPSEWLHPPKSDDGTDFTGTGGPVFTMPDCTGMTTGDCEAAVESAVSATGAGFTTAFTEAAAATYNASLPNGALVSTNPSAGAAADPSAVELDVNESDPTSWCRGYANWPHYSTSTAGVGPGMLIKGQVLCPFTGTVDAQLELWICSAWPTGSDASSIGSDPNCSSMKTCPQTLIVVADKKTKPSDFVCATGKPEVAGSWYVGAISGAQILPDISEKTEGK